MHVELPSSVWPRAAAAILWEGCTIDAAGLRPSQEPAEGAPLSAARDAGALDLDRDRVPVLDAGVSCQLGDAVVRTASGWECAAPGVPPDGDFAAALIRYAAF